MYAQLSVIAVPVLRSVVSCFDKSFEFPVARLGSGSGSAELPLVVSGMSLHLHHCLSRGCLN